MADFSGWKVSALQKYLQQRGVTYSGKRKEDLVQICQACSAISLQTDPDFACHDSARDLKKKLTDLNLTNPFNVDGFTNDLSELSPIGLYDIFNYLLETRTDYDGKKLKAFKSADDFRLFQDGAVEDLVYSKNGDHELGIVKAKVIPTQKKKTYLQETTYSVWLAIKKEAGTVVIARCVCAGGSDGACRHVGAVLYELESYHDRVRTCTDGPVSWVKRARRSDEPLPISRLTIQKPRYRDRQIKEHNTWDPRHPMDRSEVSEEELQNFVSGLHNVSPNSCCLPALEDPIQNNNSYKTPTSEAIPLTVQEKIDFFFSSLQDGDNDNNSMFASFSTSLIAHEVSRISELTVGQGSNPNWLPLRKGRITASIAHRVASRMKTLHKFPDSNTKPLLETLTTEGNDLNHLSSIAWGSGQEPKARRKYTFVERKRHSNLVVREAGLIVAKQNCLLACTPDGIVSCKCKTHVGKRSNAWLIEIKCPSRGRNVCPKQAAIDFCGVERVGTSYSLKKNHSYYTQVQMQLGLLEMRMCDLVVYTKQGLHVINVPFDDIFYASLISDLDLFARDYLFPYLLGLRFLKG